jgi:hypothetical protein
MEKVYRGIANDTRNVTQTAAAMGSTTLLLMNAWANHDLQKVKKYLTKGDLTMANLFQEWTELSARIHKQHEGLRYGGKHYHEPLPSEDGDDDQEEEEQTKQGKYQEREYEEEHEKEEYKEEEYEAEYEKEEYEGNQQDAEQRSPSDASNDSDFQSEESFVDYNEGNFAHYQRPKHVNQNESEAEHPPSEHDQSSDSIHHQEEHAPDVPRTVDAVPKATHIFRAFDDELDDCDRTFEERAQNLLDDEFRAQDYQQELLERRRLLRTYQQKHEQFRRGVEQFRADVATYNRQQKRKAEEEMPNPAKRMRGNDEHSHR